MLSARQVPAVGGATKFASTRAAYAELDEAVCLRLDTAVVEHDFSYSRALVGFEFTADESAQFPSVRHCLVRVNANNGRKSVLIGPDRKIAVSYDAVKPADHPDEVLADLARLS